jgi:putative spermidine/putrescine transport system ATP-binding protein
MLIEMAAATNHPNDTARVSLDGITKTYGDLYAVRDVSLEIWEHEFITLLGPSGSGKTTILMILAGFVQADSGSVRIDGQDITRIPPYRRNIGMVFQNYALFPHMTVADNVGYPLKMRHTPRKEARRMVAEALETVQLQGMELRRPSQLSGGQQQRVALARAMVFRPPILLMDEPLGALDKKLREHMQLELKHIQERLGITILYVTHDQEEALSMSSRIAVVNHGRIEHLGTAVEIYDRPDNRFVADFVGETNIFKAEIVESRGDMLQLNGPCLGRVRARSFRQLGVGSEVHLAVRPEKIVFLNRADVTDGHCNYPGTVEDIIFLGDITKYYVRLAHSSPEDAEGLVVMKVQNRLDARRYTRGEKVDIGWNELDATIV